MNFKSIHEVIDFAISKEQAAVDLYRGLAEKAKSSMKKVFNEFADEEVRHKQKLMNIQNENNPVFKKEEVLDLKIAEFTERVVPDSADDYQKVLILAMHEEKQAYKMYTYLAGIIDDEKVKNIFLMLAQEEAKHKLKFELEYDEKILMEN